MLSADDALMRILARCRPLLPQSLVPTRGLVLAEAACADLDMPPFDRSLMDGYAMRSCDGPGERIVAGEIMAGQIPTHSLRPGTCVRIMTGAAIPDEADSVIPVEQVVERGEIIDIAGPPIRGANILRRASEYPKGRELLPAGSVLRPQEIGVLAAIGRTMIRAIPLPRVAVLATGDELVEPPTAPGPGQIRNSNAPMLAAQIHRAGAVPVPLGIGRDHVESLTPLIREGLQADVLVLAGGVSAGKLDLVPGVLASLGVTAHFHKVNMKPGKPLLFGTTDEGRLVFGLPGNPVSAFVCFELFVRPALRTLAGHRNATLRSQRAILEQEFSHRSDRPTYHPAAMNDGSVRAVPWKASADLASLLPANALLVLPAGDVTFAAGEAVETLALDG